MDHKASWTILGEISCINILNVTFYGSTGFRDMTRMFVSDVRSSGSKHL